MAYIHIYFISFVGKFHIIWQYIFGLQIISLKILKPFFYHFLPGMVAVDNSHVILLYEPLYVTIFPSLLLILLGSLSTVFWYFMILWYDVGLFFHRLCCVLLCCSSWKFSWIISLIISFCLSLSLPPFFFPTRLSLSTVCLIAILQLLDLLNWSFKFVSFSIPFSNLYVFGLIPSFSFNFLFF